MNLTLLFRLFFEFFKTGLFALGGGLATIPFLYEMIDTFHWFSKTDLMNMIAVSESTPGPIGVNMATYVGYLTTHSILGGIITTIGLVLPSVIIICIIAKFLKSFKNSRWVQNAFYGLRPAVTAMIAVTGFNVFLTTIYPNAQTFSWIHLILIGIVSFITLKFKNLHPILIICACAGLGILLQL